MKISELGGEAALINLIRDKFGTTGEGELALGIGDDAALISVDDKYIVVTADLLVENTHFRMDINEPYLLGWKSMAVNISDVAAMGGTPTYSFVSIGLPDIEVSVVERIYEGMYDCSNAFGSVIAGGDTVSSEDGIIINVTQLGEVEKDFTVKRNNAKAGDAILVTNTIGDSLAGLQLLLQFGLEESRRINSYLVEKHLKPEPKVMESRAAVKTGKVHSMMDLSDGLSSDITKLCDAAGVGARIYAQALPVSEDLHIAAARLDADVTYLAAAGGEDYELLLTCGPRDAQNIINAIKSTGSTAKTIGEIIDERGIVLVDSNGNEKSMPGAWKHF